jgi:hypothetical protein
MGMNKFRRAEEILGYCFQMNPAGLAPNHRFDKSILVETLSTHDLIRTHPRQSDHSRPTTAVFNPLIQFRVVANTT